MTVHASDGEQGEVFGSPTYLEASLHNMASTVTDQEWFARELLVVQRRVRDGSTLNPRISAVDESARKQSKDSPRALLSEDLPSKAMPCYTLACWWKNHQEQP